MKSLACVLCVAFAVLMSAEALAHSAASAHPVDLEKERVKLTEMQALQRKAHVEENPQLLVSMMAEDFVSWP